MATDARADPTPTDPADRPRAKALGVGRAVLLLALVTAIASLADTATRAYLFLAAIFLVTWTDGFFLGVAMMLGWLAVTEFLFNVNSPLVPRSRVIIAFSVGMLTVVIAHAARSIMRRRNTPRDEDDDAALLEDRTLPPIRPERPRATLNQDPFAISSSSPWALPPAPPPSPPPAPRTPLPDTAWLTPPPRTFVPEPKPELPPFPEAPAAAIDVTPAEAEKLTRTWDGLQAPQLALVDEVRSGLAQALSESAKARAAVEDRELELRVALHEERQARDRMRDAEQQIAERLAESEETIRALREEIEKREAIYLRDLEEARAGAARAAETGNEMLGRFSAAIQEAHAAARDAELHAEQVQREADQFRREAEQLRTALEAERNRPAAAAGAETELAAEAPSPAGLDAQEIARIREEERDAAANVIASQAETLRRLEAERDTAQRESAAMREEAAMARAELSSAREELAAARLESPSQEAVTQAEDRARAMEVSLIEVTRRMRELENALEDARRATEEEKRRREQLDAALAMSTLSQRSSTATAMVDRDAAVERARLATERAEQAERRVQELEAARAVFERRIADLEARLAAAPTPERRVPRRTTPSMERPFDREEKLAAAGDALSAKLQDIADKHRSSFDELAEESVVPVEQLRKEIADEIERGTPAAAPIAPRPAAEGAEQRRARLGGRRAVLLIAHQDSGVRTDLEDGLELLGYRTFFALDGLEALRLARAYQPDVVIAASDIPKLGGRELCKFLKNDRKTLAAKIVLSSNGSESPTGEFGPDAFISEPLTVDAVHDVAMGLLS